MLDLYQEFNALIAKLSESGAPYALCGGMALAVYGIPRATVDIDLLLLNESLDQVTDLARELGYTVEANPMTFASRTIEIRRLSKIEPDSGDVLSLDLLLVTPPIIDVWNSRIKIEWEAQRLCVVSKEGLIRMKTLRGSGQDLEDISRLQESGDES